MLSLPGAVTTPPPLCTQMGFIRQTKLHPHPRLHRHVDLSLTKEVGGGGGVRHQRKTARKTKFSSPHFLISAIQTLNFDFPVPTCVLSPQFQFSYLLSMNPFWLETGSPPAVPHHPGVCTSGRRMRTQCPGRERCETPLLCLRVPGDTHLGVSANGKGRDHSSWVPESRPGHWAPQDHPARLIRYLRSCSPAAQAPPPSSRTPVQSHLKSGRQL